MIEKIQEIIDKYEVLENEAVFVGIDPDSKKSGVAIWRKSDKFYALKNLTFFELFDYLQEKKISIRLIVIEAGWLNKSTWHGAHGKCAAISAKIGKNVGSNHEAGRKIEEMCKYLKIYYELDRPQSGKLTALQFKKLTGIQERTNQETRDAFMLVFGR